VLRKRWMGSSMSKHRGVHQSTWSKTSLKLEPLKKCFVLLCSDKGECFQYVHMLIILSFFYHLEINMIYKTGGLKKMCFKCKALSYHL